MARLTRSETRANTRARIMDAARAALENKGSAGLQIEQIVRSAGFTRGAFYANFASKNELLAELIGDRMADEFRFWTDVLQHAADPEACLATIVRDAQRDGRWQAAAKLELQLEAERNLQFRPHFQAYIDAVHAELRRLFETLLDSFGKMPPPDFDQQVAGVYAFGSSLGLESSLGFRLDHGVAAFRLIHSHILTIIDRAPAAKRDVAQPIPARLQSFGPVLGQSLGDMK